MPNQEAVLPPEPEPLPSSAGYWTEQRRELKKWLGRQAPFLADLYDSALKTLHDRDILAKVHLVAHAAREIINRLPDHAAGYQAPERSGHIEKLDRIYELWLLGLPIGGSTPVTESAPAVEAVNPASISPEILSLLADLLRDHGETALKLEDKFYLLLEVIDPKNKGLKQELRPVVLHLKRLSRWFTQMSHQPKATTESDVAELQDKFANFEDTVTALVNGLFDKSVFDKSLDTLDELLENTN